MTAPNLRTVPHCPHHPGRIFLTEHVCGARNLDGTVCQYSPQSHPKALPKTLRLVTEQEGESTDMQGAFTAEANGKSFTIDATNADRIAANARAALEGMRGIDTETR